MQNTFELSKMGLQEMNVQEMTQTDGGYLIFIFMLGYKLGQKHNCPIE
jgi:hypothetical protein